MTVRPGLFTSKGFAPDLSGGPNSYSSKNWVGNHQSKEDGVVASLKSQGVVSVLMRYLPASARQIKDSNCNNMSWIIQSTACCRMWFGIGW